MAETTVSKQVAPIWYSRPVFFVSDIERSIRFYIEQLGFWKKWPEGDGTVCQMNRGDCEIILCQSDRRDKSRVFLELNPSGLEELQREIAARSVPFEKTWWGYDVMRIVDPDGNELLVCLEF